MREPLRKYPLFSLCGLCCACCPMFHISEERHCTGCGGEGRPACAVIRCAKRHGGVEFCFECPEYPCERYRGERPDSFVPVRNAQKEFDQIKAVGPRAHQELMNEKAMRIRFLLSNYNDGRKKSFFCLAVNLLDPETVGAALARLSGQTRPGMTVKEKAALAVGIFQEAADRQNVVLKLNKKK